MATSTEQINNLIASNTALLEYFQGARDQIDARVDAVLEDIDGVLDAKFYINAATGSDANDGTTTAAPLQTVGEAVSRMISGCVYTLVLETDIVIDGLLTTGAAVISMQSNVDGTNRTVTIAPERANQPTSDRLPGFQSSGGALLLYLYNISLSFPVAAAHVTGKYFLHGSGFVTANLRNSEILRDVGADTQLLSGELGAYSLQLTNTTYPAEMAGKWLKSVAAGVDPGTIDYLLVRGITSL